MNELIDAHKDHSRAWKNFLYVYAVISRRSRGVSIGINLNPDKICNFNCAYCEVDHKTPPRAKEVNLQILKNELEAMLQFWQSGKLFQETPFSSAPANWRRLNDIAFSGDGEPTTCPLFSEAVNIAADALKKFSFPETKLVLITNATCLDRPDVKEGLKILRKEPHEIWAKLDAGTPEYYKLINRTSVSYERILKNITETSKEIPLTIQSLFTCANGQPPQPAEIEAYCDRIQSMLDAGGKIQKLQLYTIARPTPETWVTALSKEELDTIAKQIQKRISLPQELFYGV